MKKTGIILIFITIAFLVSGQEPVKEKQEENRVAAVSDTNENTKVVIGENLVTVEDTKDALKVRVGNRGLNILQSLEGGPKFVWEKFTGTNVSEPTQDAEKKEDKGHQRRHFRGHWSGIEFGFNNYLTSDNSMVLPGDISYMNLHSSKSNNFNLNLPQLSLGMTRYFGVVTGLGINWNNYRFDGNFNIQKRPNGLIDSLSPIATLKKSKLATVYMTLPVLLELQLPVDNHHINLAAGFIGAIKLDSHTKMVFEGGDDVKSYGDFNLNLLRYGATARIGYRNLQIYGTYYMTPLFEKGRGPGGYDLFPFEIGFSFSCFN
jgi:hypothetical protein